jgi:hypothetical protein
MASFHPANEKLPQEVLFIRLGSLLRRKSHFVTPCYTKCGEEDTDEGRAGS